MVFGRSFIFLLLKSYADKDYWEILKLWLLTGSFIHIILSPLPFTFFYCLYQSSYMYIYIHIFLAENCQRRHRKQTMYGGVWVGFLGIRTVYLCISYFKRCSQWQQQRLQYPYFCLTKCMLSFKSWRSLQLFGTEETFCWKWCQDNTFKKRRRRRHQILTLVFLSKITQSPLRKQSI